ncbi:putative reverse transcriptase domain-containing protein [Tanacetum coccineum]
MECRVRRLRHNTFISYAVIGTMAGVDINTLTMEQYLALSRENQASGVVKPEIGGNVNFEIKSQLMRELREDSFSENKDEDAHDHIDQGLSTMNHQLLDSHGAIPEMRPAQALTAIQTMADHSQKWHDRTTSRNIRSNSKDGLAALVGCQICEGPHLDKDCPLNKEVKQVEEIEQLTKEIHSDKILNSSSKQIKIVTSDQETYGLNKLYGVSFISGTESNTPEVLQHQLPRKELNPGSFTLSCTIGKFNFYAMANLCASINVMLRSVFEHLHFINLKKTNMLYEMADMSKKAPLGIVENVLVKIDKFLFPSDFVILDNTPSETTILGRPFLATIHAKIDVFAGRISLGINKDRISFDTMRKDHNPSEIFFMVRPQSPGQSNNQIDYEESGNWDNRSRNFDDRDPKKRKINLDENVPRAHFYNPIK